MQFFYRTVITALSILALASSSLATTASVSYDNTYDDSSASLDIVACSNGANGLLTKGYTTFGSLPSFPRIGGAAAVAGWNSVNCGTCWQLTYNDVSIVVLAIDHTDDGFNISEEALNELTNGQAVDLGRVTATVTQVDAKQCGL